MDDFIRKLDRLLFEGWEELGIGDPGIKDTMPEWVSLQIKCRLKAPPELIEVLEDWLLTSYKKKPKRMREIKGSLISHQQGVPIDEDKLLDAIETMIVNQTGISGTDINVYKIQSFFVKANRTQREALRYGFSPGWGKDRPFKPEVEFRAAVKPSVVEKLRGVKGLRAHLRKYQA
jgi:hypothetical protein